MIDLVFLIGDFSFFCYCCLEGKDFIFFCFFSITTGYEYLDPYRCS